MTVETQLRSAMADAVAPVTPDADLLVATARRRGLGIRRRRQALGAVGIAAALAVAVAAPSFVAGDHPAAHDDRVLVGSTTVAFDPTNTATITGRSNTAALLYAVGLQVSGTARNLGGGADASEPGIVQTAVGFSFTPAGTTGAGDIGMNVQYVDPSTQHARKSGDPEPTFRCDAQMVDCHLTRFADGSALRTYVEHSAYGDRTGIQLIADLDRADDVRIVAWASNGYDVIERDVQVNRVDPVLTRAQLEAIVRQPWWGVRLPTYFTAKGAELEPFSGDDNTGSLVAGGGRPDVSPTAQTTVPPTSDPMP